MNCSVEYCVALEDDALLSDSLQDILLSERRRTQDSVCSSLAPVCGRGLCLDGSGWAAGCLSLLCGGRVGNGARGEEMLKMGFFFSNIEIG